MDAATRFDTFRPHRRLRCRRHRPTVPVTHLADLCQRRHDEEDSGHRHDEQDLRFRPDGDLGFTPDGQRCDGAPPSDSHQRDGAPPSQRRPPTRLLPFSAPATTTLFSGA
jgi:hypothetical protein